MCGIVAVCGTIARETVVAMRDALAHRGPDAAGLAWWPEAALAHRRLSIIDLDGGRQPLANEDGCVWVSFNGEIYNYLDLRAELEAAGHRFATRSDTEVLVHLYEQYGVRCVERLRGDFAFAIWDRHSRSLFAARDRLGVKPLYFARDGQRLLLASEIKAILACPSVSREVDPDAIDAYLSYLYIPPPRTAFRQIRQLPPAHWLRFCSGSLRIERYWSAPLQREGGPSTLQDAVTEARDALDEAVRIRLMSEVPLGAFLSGGIDSSSLVAAMVRASSQPVRTFTIRFGREHPLYDEGPAARRVARHLGTTHVELEAQADCAELLPAMIGAFDQPFGNPTALLVYLLAKLTRQHVTVALAGDGGDELFGGYPRYRGLCWLSHYERVPLSVRRLAARLADRVLRDDLDGRHDWRRLREFLQAGGKSLWDGYLGWIGYWDGLNKRELYTPEFQGELDGVDEGRWLESQVAGALGSDDCDLLAAAAALDMRSFLPENVLAYSDRMSMAHALEIRVPMTDHVLIERVLPLGRKWKWHGGRLKGLLRAAQADRLPAETIGGPKAGFNPPMAAWLRGQLAGLLEEYLSPKAVRDRGLFQAAKVARIRKEFVQGGRDYSLHLWALVVLESWMRRMVDTPPERRVASAWIGQCGAK